METMEDAFIRGDWSDVLQQSREKLLERVAAAETRDAATDEALVSMYLQSVFELSKHDEVETAEMLMRSLAPLPFELTMQWIKFLVAMDNKAVALELLNESLQQCASEIATSNDPRVCRSRYVQLTELLVFHVLSAQQNPHIVRDYIANDSVLDEATKQRILDAAHASQAPAEVAPPLQAPKTPTTSTHTSANSTSTHITTTTFSSRRTGTETPESDPAGDLVAIGGTALAVAAVAIGVYRYRDTLRDAVAEIGPAVSKGLADAKYALFES